MTMILDADSVISEKIETLKEQCAELTKNGLTPKLGIILVGNNPASLSYIKGKKKLCEKIGADFELIQLEADTDERTFLAEIEKLNIDSAITGCFVQLPVPKHLQHLKITQLINPNKDVDGFHINSLSQMYHSELDGLISCTPKGILTLLDHHKFELSGKHVVIVGRSLIVGRPLSLLMQAKDATVTLCHAKTQNLSEHTKMADIIISATGNPEFLTSDYFAVNKNQILIDVGISRKDGKLVGDMDFNVLKDKVFAITRVPGGIGPLTVFSLMQNLIIATNNIIKMDKK